MKKVLMALLAMALTVVSAPVRADFVKQSAAYTRTVLMLDSSDHITGKTGLTLTITLSKNGASFSSITPTVTEIGNGRYSIALTTTHTNTLGPLDMFVTATGADPTDTHDQVVAFDPSDGAAFGLSRLDAAVSSRLASGNVTIGGYATNQDPATLVLGATASSFNTSGTIGQKINSAASATDPLTATLSGYTTGGTFGNLMRLFSGGVDSNGYVRLQATTHTGAIIPTVTSVGSVSGSVGSISGISFPNNFTLLTINGSGQVAIDTASQNAVAAAVLGSVIDGTITLKQAQALQIAVNTGRYVSGSLNTGTHQRTITYYRQDGTTLLATATITYNSGNTDITGRTVTFTNLP